MKWRSCGRREFIVLYALDYYERPRSFFFGNLALTLHIELLATSKNGILLLRRYQGEMAVFWDSRSRRL